MTDKRGVQKECRIGKIYMCGCYEDSEKSSRFLVPLFGEVRSHEIICSVHLDKTNLKKFQNQTNWDEEFLPNPHIVTKYRMFGSNFPCILG